VYTAYSGGGDIVPADNLLLCNSVRGTV